MNVANSRQAKLTRLLIQTSAIERTSRQIRTQLEAELAQTQSVEETGERLQTGLETLLSGREGMPLQNITPYESLANAACHVGLDANNAEVESSIAAGLSRPAYLDDRERIGNTLILQPTFWTEQSPGWVTVESMIDLPKTPGKGELSVTTMCWFDVHPAKDPRTHRGVDLQIRGHFADGSFKDLGSYRLPITSLPIEHTARLKLDLSGSGKTAVTKLEALMFLPTWGTYAFNINLFKASWRANA